MSGMAANRQQISDQPDQTSWRSGKVTIYVCSTNTKQGNKGIFYWASQEKIYHDTGLRLFTEINDCDWLKIEPGVTALEKQLLIVEANRKLANRTDLQHFIEYNPLIAAGFYILMG